MTEDRWKAWPAPAKLNLFLHITGRRADGYHELQTLFQFLDHGDELDFEPLPGGHVEPARPLAGVDPEQDLTVCAARRLRAVTGHPDGVRIHVRKRLPMGGGVGGGSSDAATTLVALNTLWGTGLDAAALGRLGLELGADVPIFVHGTAAWAEGVGERFTPVAPPEPFYLVIHPGVQVSTAAVFSDPGLTRDSPPITISDFLAGQAGNVCETVVRPRYPEVDQAMGWLAGQGATPRLTGTGACVFAAFDTEGEARAVSDRLPARWQGFVARGCNRSPLMDRLDSG
ncbi:MAG: 4-(cytidine 5'-diphospho)-2-C-methyl-D-erythritol kinase [Ectothiorhodospira sp.]